MADYTKSDWAVQKGQPANPAGLTQHIGQREQANAGADQYSGLVPWTTRPYRESAQSWFGGRNLEGPDSGWNTEFMQRSIDQQREYEEKAFQSGRSGDFYDWLDPSKNRNATGVALWNDEDAKTGRAGGMRAGDVYDRGVYQGNLYDMYDEADADLMISAWMFDGRTQKKLNKGSSEEIAANYREAVEQQIEANTKHKLYHATSREFEEDVEATKDSIRSSWGGAGDELLAASAGAVGTAPMASGAALAAGAATAWMGPGAAVVAGITFLGVTLAGTASAVLNKDQYTEVAARAWQIADRANSQHNALGAAFSFAGESSQLLMMGQSPLQNLVQGAYDIGERGDGESRFYSMDPDTGKTAGNWIKGLNYAAMAGDAFLQFSSPQASAMYLSTMGVHTLGRVGSTVATRATFNDLSGQWDDLEGWREWSAQVGSIGIDAVQMGIAGKLGAVGASSRKAAGLEPIEQTWKGGPTLTQRGEDWLSRKGDELTNWNRRRQGKDEIVVGDDWSTDTINGIKFFRNAEGEVVSSRLTLQAFVPSEFTRWVPTGFRARQVAARGKGALTTDDLYKAALEMSSTGSRFGDALVNGYAEAWEEAAQAWLDPRAYGESATWGEITQGAMAGMMSGVGMGLGNVNMRAKTADMEKQRAKFLYQYRNDLWGTDQATFDKHFDEVWDRLDAAGRKRMTVSHTGAEDTEIRDILRTFQERHRFDRMFASPVGMYAGQDMRLQAFEDALAGRNPNMDGSLQLMSISSEDLVGADGMLEKGFASHAGVMSFWQVTDVLKRIADGHRVQHDSEAARVADLEKALLDKTITDEQRAQIQTKLAESKLALEDLVLQMQMSDRFADGILQSFNRIRDETDWNKVERMIDRTNKLIRDAWASSDIQIRRTVEFQTSRHPLQDVGSVSVLMPQISKNLTRNGVNGTVHTYQGGLKVLGGDHDGDTRVYLNSLYLTPEQRERIRRGGVYLKEMVVDADGNEIKEDELYDENGELITEPEKIAEEVLRRQIEGKRRWVVDMDPPDGEAVYVHQFAKFARDDGPQADLVNGHLDQLVALFNKRYGKRLGRAEVRRLTKTFREEVLAGEEDARMNLINGLHNIGPNSAAKLLEMGGEKGGSEAQFMTRRITQSWDSMQRGLGMLAWTTKKEATTSSEGRRPEDQRWLEAKSILDAQSIGDMLSILFGTDSVRNAQHLHYTPFLHSATATFGADKSGWVSADVQRLEDEYMRLGSGDVQSELNRLGLVNSIENRPLFWLRQMVESIPGVENVPQMMFVLAQTRVQNVKYDDQGVPRVTEGNITLLQLLLQRSLDIEEMNNSGMREDSDLAKKIHRLRRMTVPQGKHSYSASEALIELFSGFQLYDLLGDEAEYLGAQKTLGQLRKETQGRHERTRKRKHDEWQRAPGAYIRKKVDFNGDPLGDPPYPFGVYTNAQLNAYTVIVDALIAVNNTGHKARKGQNATVHKNVIKGFNDFKTFMGDWRKAMAKDIPKDKNGQITDQAVLRHILENRPDIARQIANLIPNDARYATFRVGEDGRVYTASWVEEMLLAETAEKAALLYFVHSKLDEYNALGGRIDRGTEEQENDAEGTVRTNRIQSRFLQTLHHLAQQPDKFELDRFMKALHQSQSLDQLFDRINSEPMWRNDREKLLPWFDDVAQFEVDPKDLWQANMAGSQQREALAGWGSRIGPMGKSALEALAKKEQDNSLIRKMRSAYTGKVADQLAQGKAVTTGGKKVTGTGLKALVQLDLVIKNARAMPDANGSVARDQLLQAAIDGMLQQHNKGAADPRVAPFGEMDVLSTGFGVKQGAFLEVDNITQIDFADLRMNPSQLVMGPRRIMFDDGRSLIVDLSSIEGVLKALENESTRALAKVVLSPIVRDVDANNVSQMYIDLDTTDSLNAILESANLTHVFNGNEKPTLKQAHRYIGMVESFIKRQAADGTKEEKEAAFRPIQNLLHDVIVAYQQGPYGESASNEALRDQAVIDVAYALQVAGNVPDDEVDAGLKMVKDIMRSRLTGEEIPSDLRNDLDSALEDAGMIAYYQDLVDMRIDELLEKQLTFDATTPPKKVDELTKELKQLKEAKQAIASGDPMAMFANQYRGIAEAENLFRIRHGEKDAEAQKRHLLLFMQDKNRLNRFRDKKRNQLINKIRELDARDTKAINDPDLISAKEWDEVTGWAMAAYIAEGTVRSGSTVSLVPLAMDPKSTADRRVHKYYDMTWGYLAEVLYDPQVRAATDFIARRADFTAAMDAGDAAIKITTGLLSEKKLGQWSDRVPVESLKLRKVLEGASVGMGVTIAGNDPKTMADYVGSGWVGFERPLDEHFSVYNTGGDASQSLRDTATPLQWLKLHNHFVRSIKIRSPKLEDQGVDRRKAGEWEMLLAWGRQSFAHDDVDESGYRVFDINVVSEQLDKLIQDQGLDDWEIEVEYVDVDKKPHTREYANSVYFDGVGRQDEAMGGAGPLAATVFGLGGLSKIGQQDPLNFATKGGASFKAYHITDLENALQIEREAGSFTELIQEKVLHIIAQNYDTGMLMPADYPAIYKFLKQRHIVKKGQGENATFHWVEEIIQQEQEALERGEPIDMTDMTLVPLSDRVARTLLGNSGTLGVTQAQNPMVLNLQDLDRFPSLDRERLKNLGLERLGEEVALENSPMAQIVQPPQARPSDTKGAEVKTMYELTLRQQKADAQPVLEYRSEKADSGRAKFDPIRTTDERIAKMQERMNREDMVGFMHRLHVPIEMFRDMSREIVSMHLVRRVRDLMPYPQSMFWTYEPDGVYSDSTGVLTASAIANNFEEMGRQSVVHGDAVEMHLDKILQAHGDDMDAAIKHAKHVIEILSKKGVTIYFTSETAGTMMRGVLGQWMREGKVNYAPVANSSHIFAPAEPDAASRTRRSLASTDTEVKVFTTQGLTLGFVTDTWGGHSTENASLADTRFDPQWKRTSAVILPTSLTATGVGARGEQYAFNNPVPGTDELDQRGQVRQKLLEMLRSKEGRKQLQKMAGDVPKNVPIYRENKGAFNTPGVRSTKDALRILEQTLEADSWPLAQGNTLVAGDFIPLVDRHGRIVLTRLGFKMPAAADLTEQFKQTNDKGKRLDIAVAPAKVEPSHTVPPPFVIEELHNDAQKGLVAIGEWDLQSFSKEERAGSGFKAGLIPMPYGVEFHEIGLTGSEQDPDGNGLRVTRITSATAVIGKGAEEGLADNYRTAFAIFGMDFRKDIIKTLFGDRTPSGDPDQDERAFQADWAKARSILNRWADMDHQTTSEQVNQMLDGQTEMLYIRDELHQATGDLYQSEVVDFTQAFDPSTTDASAKITALILATLMAPGVRPEHVVATPGLATVRSLQENLQVQYMPPLFTDALMAPDFQGVRTELHARMNANMPVDPTTGQKLYELDEHFNFWLAVKDHGETRWEKGLLQIIMPVPAQSNAENYVQAMATSGRQGATQHVTNVLNSTVGGRIELMPPRTPGGVTAQDTWHYDVGNIMRFDPGNEDRFFDMITRSIPDHAYSPWERILPMEGDYVDRAADRVDAYTRLIERKPDFWSDAERKQAETITDDILHQLNLDQKNVLIRQEMDFLVRQFIGRPGIMKGQEDYEEVITGKLYVQALELIKQNVFANMNPLHGGVVALPHRDFLWIIYDAQRGKDSKWAPKRDSKGKALAKEWDEWVNAIHGMVRTSDLEFNEMFLTDVDGFFHTYQGSTESRITQAMSTEQLRSIRLLRPDVNEFMLSLSEGRDALLKNPLILDSGSMTLDALVGNTVIFGQADAFDAEASELQAQLDRQKAFLAGKTPAKQKKVSYRNYVQEGAYYQESHRNGNAFMRGLVNLSITMRLFNPALFVSSILEVGIRNTTEHITNVLTGRYTGPGGQLMAEATERMGMTPWLSAKDQRKLKQLAKSMGESNRWLSLLYDEMTYQSLVEGNPEGARSMAKGIERAAQFTARAFSDPTYGQRATSVAMRYLEASLEYLLQTNNAITVDQLVEKMSKDPMWLKDQFSQDRVNPHKLGMMRVAQVRSTKQTVAGMAITKPIDSLASADSTVANFAGHLLKIPFAFARFNLNALTTLTGLSGFDQAAAMLMDGRQQPKFWRNMRKRANGDASEIWEMQDVIDSIDLQRTFIRAGTNQTMLFTLAMMAGNMGFDGEDEEEKRRQRLARYHSIPHYLDPYEAQNSFTYADAIFLDETWLAGLFKDPDTGRSAVIPHWTVQQFTSPIMGMQQFFETGDFRWVGWGFNDALSAIPYGIKSLWNEADATARMLVDEARAADALANDIEEAGGDAGEPRARATQFLINAVFVYEKMLIENSFINTIRNGLDDYDRNPQVVTKINEEGTQLVDTTTGAPQPTDTLLAWAEDGETGVTYDKREGLERELYQHAENNGTFALIASLFTGLNDSEFLRRNMAIRERNIYKAPVDLDRAKTFLAAQYESEGGIGAMTLDEARRMVRAQYEAADVRWDNETVELEAAAIVAAHDEMGALSYITPDGYEELTKAGADTILHSIRKGAVEPGDPSLQGFYIDYDTRNEIAQDWMEQILQEGVDLGLPRETAEYRARRFWYGDATTGQIGIKDIIYDDRISYSKKMSYNQMNTTYTMGPDGKPWATPFQRQSITQALGFIVQPTVTHEAAIGTKLDERGMVVDEVLGINTGLHALERKAEPAPPEPPDFPLEEALKKDTSDRESYAKKAFGGYGGGGGGGGGYTREMRAFPRGIAPAIDRLPNMNTANPFIRRARVNRQRITSQRGRLKQWQ